MAGSSAERDGRFSRRHGRWRLRRLIVGPALLVLAFGCPAFASEEQESVLARGNVEIRGSERAMVWGRVPVQFSVGVGVSRLEVLLDEKVIAELDRPPWRTALKLGSLPEPHLLEVQALSESGELLGRDRRQLNAGQGHLAVKIRQPEVLSPGERVLVDLDVDLPRGNQPVGVEVSWGDRLLRRFSGPPYRGEVELPATPGWLRVVALGMGPGETAEDILLPAGDDTDYRYQSEVSVVELFASVRGRDGAPPLDMEAGEFSVVEDGKQQLVRFVESAAALPLTVALVLDSSTSMEDDQAIVRGAAQEFVDRLAPGDRALVVSFSGQPEYVIGPTADGALVRSALEKIEIGRSTALHEALAYSVVQLRGVEGRRAIVLLTDGMDSSGQFTLQQASTIVRRAGLPVFLVRLDGKDGLMRRPGPWMMLDRLVMETGGHVSSLRGIDELRGVWQGIADELAAQLRIGFRGESGRPGWRRIEVDTTRAGVKVRAPGGYWRR